VALGSSASSGCGRLEHGHDARVIQIADRDAFEMRADAAQFRSHEAVHKMQTPVEPREQFVLDLVVNRERDLSAIWPDLSEINDAHKGNVPAHGLEGILVWRVALDRQEDRVRLKAERAAEAEIDRFG